MEPSGRDETLARAMCTGTEVPAVATIRIAEFGYSIRSKSLLASVMERFGENLLSPLPPDHYQALRENSDQSEEDLCLVAQMLEAQEASWVSNDWIRR